MRSVCATTALVLGFLCLTFVANKPTLGGKTEFSSGSKFVQSTMLNQSKDDSFFVAPHLNLQKSVTGFYSRSSGHFQLTPFKSFLILPAEYASSKGILNHLLNDSLTKAP